MNPAGLVGDVLELLDSGFDYFFAKFRLERYRIETHTRRLVLRMAVLLGSAAVLLIGLVFLSVGIADMIGEGLESPALGRLIVGGFYFVAGAIALAIGSRRGDHVEKETRRHGGRA